MKAYKLTDQNGQTKTRMQWGPNVTHSATGQSKYLCSNGWIHFYTNPLLAVLLNPIHASFSSPKLWECETSGEELHEPLKSGCKTLTTIREISLPEISLTQKIAFGILCAKEMYKNVGWNEWADKWLSGEDRTKGYAKDTAFSITSLARSVAASSAYAAASSAYADYASATATASASVAYYAYCAAVKSNVENSIDFIKLAEKALTYK